MKRTLRHPIRGDRLHPKPSNRPARRSSWRTDGRQPRMRPRKSVNVASIVGSPEEEESRPNLRLRVVGVVVLVLFGVLILRLWTLQVIDGKTYAAAVTRNQVRVVSIQAPRGEIVDRNGTVLVSNTPQEEILLSREEAAQNPGIIGMVAALVGETPKQVQTAVNNVQYSPYEPVPVASGVSLSTVQYLQTHQAEYPGVSVQSVTQRTYPQGGTTGTHVLGYVGQITSSFLAAHPNQGYTQGSQIGLAGIEQQYEPYLRGVDGRQALSVDASGNVVGTLSTTAPQIGDTVVLNIDTDLQQAVQGYLQQQILTDRHTLDAVDNRIPPAPNGAAIVMDPQNGQVLALASYPSYDLNDWVGGISSANYAALSATTAENDEAIEGLYTPGSTFKLVTATAALQDGLISPTTPYVDTGHFKIPGCPAPGVIARHRLHPERRPGRHRRHLQRVDRADGIERLVLLQPRRHVLGRPRPVRRHADPERGDGLRRGHHHRHRPAGRGAGPGRQLPDPGQAARRGAQGLPQHAVVVHRRQRRDGLRPGPDRS